MSHNAASSMCIEKLSLPPSATEVDFGIKVWLTTTPCTRRLTMCVCDHTELKLARRYWCVQLAIHALKG